MDWFCHFGSVHSMLTWKGAGRLWGKVIAVPALTLTSSLLWGHGYLSVSWCWTWCLLVAPGWSAQRPHVGWSSVESQVSLLKWKSAYRFSFPRNSWPWIKTREEKIRNLGSGTQTLRHHMAPRVAVCLLVSLSKLRLVFSSRKSMVLSNTSNGVLGSLFLPEVHFNHLKAWPVQNTWMWTRKPSS